MGQPVSYLIILFETTCILHNHFNWDNLYLTWSLLLGQPVSYRIYGNEILHNTVIFPQQNLFNTIWKKTRQFYTKSKNMQQTKKSIYFFHILTYSPLRIDDVILEEICKWSMNLQTCNLIFRFQSNIFRYPSKLAFLCKSNILFQDKFAKVSIEESTSTQSTVVSKYEVEHG